MFRFGSSSTGNTHAFLNNVDSGNNIRIRTDIVLNAGNGCSIRKQPFHFGLGAAVAQLEVVQHGIVLLGKALVCVLDESDVRTHLIGVIRHVGDSHIRIFDCGLRITAQGLDKRCGEGCDRGHIVVSRHTRRFICVGSVFLQFAGGLLEQGVDTAHKLFVFAVGFDDSLAQGYCGGSGSGDTSAHCHTDSFQSAAQLGEFAFAVIGGIPGIIQFLFQVIGRVTGVIHLLAEPVHSLFVIRQFTLHAVQGGLGIVQLDLPCLGTAVILTKGLGGIGESLFQHLDLFALGFDLLGQHLMPCGEGFGRTIILGELGLHQFHFGTQNLERLVDFRQSLFELLLALKTDLQTEIICHFTTAFPLDSVRDNVINEHLPFRFGDTVVLFMALPKVEE